MSTEPLPAFQDQFPVNHCFCCGADNPKGLQIKSRWIGTGEAECLFTPQPHHCAGPQSVVNGGILASVIDCHGVCTATAYAYEQENRAIGSDPLIWYVTGSMTIEYKLPVPMGGEIRVIAKVFHAAERKTVVDCSLYSGKRLCNEGRVLAVQVPDAWHPD